MFLFIFLAALAVGISEPHWESMLKGKQKSVQFPLLFYCSVLFIHTLYNKSGADNTGCREWARLCPPVGRAIKIGSEG